MPGSQTAANIPQKQLLERLRGIVSKFPKWQGKMNSVYSIVRPLISRVLLVVTI
jgi:hypothetical protein